MSIKSALFSVLAVIVLAAGFIAADGLYQYAEAQGEAARVAELDAGAGPSVEVTGGGIVETHLDGAGPNVAPPLEPVNTTTTTTISTTTTPADDPVDSVRDVIAGARSGNWRMAVGALLVLAMLGLKTARDKTKWFSGDRGGAVLVLSLSLAGALSTSLATGLPIDLRMLLGVLGVAFTAAGGYSVIKSLFWPAKKAG